MIGIARGRRRADGNQARRQPLLALVFGIFLVCTGGMAAALSVLVGAHFSAATMNTTISHDRALIRLWAGANLQSDDLNRRITAGRMAELELQLAALVERGEILHLELRAPDGTILLSNHGGLQGRRAAASTSFTAAVGGDPAAGLLESGVDAEAVGFTATTPLLRDYLPIISADDEVVAVAGLWRDATPILDRLEATRQDVLIVTAIGALVLGIVLLIVSRAAQRRLTRQSEALLEGTRRDPLTGLLNHGAIVGGLADRLEVGRVAGVAVSIGIIDVDNFRLLNDTHGHAAGDTVLLRVSHLLGTVAPGGTLVGRYGPDEFLVASPPMAVEVTQRVVDELRSALRDVVFEFGDSEPLPITVSAGLASFPDAAEAVTDLLMAATAAAAEAKASGGDEVRHALAGSESPAAVRGFSVLQGLVMAIDTKDRYTKRHSEDVARYALFLAERLGLGNEELETVRLAALLHDVGKVGIPDTLLRKPGRLSQEEREVFEQHVVLGHLIVRDLPHLDGVTAGVRYHHERWDGTGYPDRLCGDEIPLVARIVAIADTFSAMTTSRPYRKALSVQEALRRLSDAGGTQLEDRLVREFIGGMQTAPDAPLPDDERSRPRLWMPVAEVA
ncbi:MAG: bifunctional diguanylate cyclase/phosphohydrolase [Candidatus Limnocylindria bacterium]